MLARADGNAGAAARVVFEYPKFPMMPVYPCFARRSKPPWEAVDLQRPGFRVP